MAKAPRISAGIALLRRRDGVAEVLLVHPGGPFWTKKDEHGWSLPKGELDEAEIESDESAEATARREFEEETGHPVPVGPLVALTRMRITSGKYLRAFAAAGDLDPDTITSNTFEMEWPPRSGRQQSFPEVDRAAWFPLDAARTKLHKGQIAVVDQLEEILAAEVLALT